MSVVKINYTVRPPIEPHQIVMGYLDPIVENKHKIHAVVHGILGRNLSFVFCPPPLGRPHPKARLDPSMTLPRPRIIQSAQKGLSCFYFALNRIRFHPEKDSSSLDIRTRRAEADVAVVYHKKCVDIHEQQIWKVDLAHSATDKFGSITKKSAEKLLKGDYKLLKDEDLEKFRILLEEFRLQTKYNDLLTFATATCFNANIDNNTTFMKIFTFEPKKYYEDQHRPLLKKSWQSLSLLQKTWSTTSASNTRVMTLFRSQKSSWHPSYPIQYLIEQIDLYGSHVITGYYGQAYYPQPAFELSEQIGGRAVFGWHPNQMRINENGITHSVVVVGARSDKKLVYFTDPLDVSDPQNPEPVYVMSYERLKKSIFNLDAVCQRDLGSEYVTFDRQDGTNNYAVYADPELAKL